MFAGTLYSSLNSCPLAGVIPCVLPPKTAYGVILSALFCVTPFRLPVSRELGVPETNVIWLVGFSSTFTENAQNGWSLLAFKSTYTSSPGLTFCALGVSEKVRAALTLGNIRASVSNSFIVFMG